VKSIQDWLKAGEYLPAFMRDFHDQKNLFQAIHHYIPANSDERLYEQPSWINGQIYVIDVFLWWMARRGYTLQRTHKKGEFRSVEEDVEAVRNYHRAKFMKLWNERPNKSGVKE